MDTEYEDQLEERGSEVIDVEEEDNEEEEEEEELEGEVFPFDEALFIRKLREKPQFPKESQECGRASPKNTYQDYNPPVADRLSLQALTSVDLLKQLNPQPEGCVPPLALPSWHFMPLEKKIPLLQSPKGLFYYTRGHLGQMLHRKSTFPFCVYDPYNRERVIFEPYNSLHDPCVKDFLYTPLIHNLLLKRGLINESNEVLCSLREFNKFRDYLRTMYCDQIWGEMEASDTFLRCERAQLRMLLRAESQDTGREAIVSARIAAAKKFQEYITALKRQKQAHKDHRTEARLRQWKNDRDRRILESIMRGIAGTKGNKSRLEALHERRLQERRNMMIKSTRKFLETQERQQNDKAMMKTAYNKFLMEWIQSKYIFCYEKLVEKKQLQEALKEAQKYRARKRQVRLEKYREEMPNIVAKKKAEKERLWEIVRKFAMRWLTRVRNRLNAPKDEKHESCWLGQSKNVLEDTVKYLRQESGYEKLDDFILNIMKLKKQIQAQIELEEAEEAAMEAARHAAEEEEDEADAETEAEAEANTNE